MAKRWFIGFLVFSLIWIMMGGALADEYIVTVNNLFVRTSPDTDSEWLGKLSKDTHVEVLKYGKEWSTIRYNGETAYVASAYLVKYDPNQVGLYLTTTQVKFRGGPSRSSEVIGKLSKGIPVIAYPSVNGWAQVIYNGTTGYIKGDYLECISANGEIPLGTYSTSYAGSGRGRCKNIELGAKKLNGSTISVRDTFSLLSVLGPIDKEGGYFEAPEYKVTEKGTETVTGYGGGVCQIATTLYQAIKVAQTRGYRLSVVKRFQHSKPVGYVPEGEDATISWESRIDFSFKNKYNSPIKILVFTGRDTLSVAIISQP